MEKIRTQNLSFSYPNSAAALRDVSLSVDEGQFVALCGPSGCGKTTLLRLLKPKISPSGTSAGEIFFEEKPISALSDREAAENIGFVFQDPDNQIVTDKVWHELAFGLESLGISSEEIRLRVAETASFFGIEPWFRKNVSELSGGQKQILNLASAMVMRPSLLILDEPTGQLDPIAATEFLHLLKRINEDLGTTVIISEHRGEELFSLCDSIIVMENGGILARGTALEVAQELLQNGSGSFFAMPTAMRVWSAVENDDVCPVSVRQGRTWLENYASKHTLSSLNASETESNANENALVLRDLWYRYKRGGEDVLRGVNCEIRKGEIFAILGGNGAGKTTALSVISGILRPLRGRVEQSGRAALMPQDPLLLFSRSTLDTDLRDTLEPLGIPKHEKERRLSEVIKLCDLDGLLERHPFDLSGGQRQSAALAKLLLLEPDILLLDEPTKGLDAASKHRLSALLKQLCENGTTVVLVSHDVEFCAVCADRCAMFFDGEIVGVAEPHTFFSNKRFYTTAAARMAADLLPLAITADEIILACGAVPPPSPTDGDFGGFSDDPTPAPDAAKAPVRRPSARSVICALILLALIPLTIIFGLRFTGERQYYFISILVILEAMLPFFLIFEGRKPRARELVVIAVLCAFAVAGRAAFYMIPQFKPTLAVIIITGACFGGEAGFIVGALGAFISNFFASQGPWTPWQMFAMGLVGLMAGLVFYRGTLEKSRTALCIFGAAATIVVYGGIMNPAGILISQANPTFQAILAAYALGLPFDLIQAAATALFLWLIAPAMTEKLRRVKNKFGIRLTA